jgi:hypothetical protein
MGQSTFKVRFGTIKIVFLSPFCSVMIIDCTHSADNQSVYSEALIVYQGAKSVRFDRVEVLIKSLMKLMRAIQLNG